MTLIRVCKHGCHGREPLLATLYSFIKLYFLGVTGSKSLAMSGETVTMTCQVFGWDQSSAMDVTWTTSVNYQKVTYTDDNGNLLLIITNEPGLLQKKLKLLRY